MDVDTEQDRVLFVKSVAQFMVETARWNIRLTHRCIDVSSLSSQATKAHIKLNTKKLYGADGYAVKELLKIASMLYDAMRTNRVNQENLESEVSSTDFNTKSADLKMCRQLASEITQHGSKLSDLLKQEVELREMRMAAIARPLELNEIEKGVQSGIGNVTDQIRQTVTRLDNLASDEANLETKIEKKKQELERNQKRLTSLQNVRPAFMDEYEKLEVELQKQYEEYMVRFRNLTFLEHQLEEQNKMEQEKMEATNLSLQEMQRRMQEQEQLLSGAQNVLVNDGNEDGLMDEIIDEEDQGDDDELIMGEEEQDGRRVFGTMTGDGLEDEGSSLSTADSEDVGNGQLLGGDSDDEEDLELEGHGSKQEVNQHDSDDDF
jgi:clusterin-associated protein 1